MPIAMIDADVLTSVERHEIEYRVPLGNTRRWNIALGIYTSNNTVINNNIPHGRVLWHRFIKIFANMNGIAGRIGVQISYEMECVLDLGAGVNICRVYLWHVPDTRARYQLPRRIYECSIHSPIHSSPLYSNWLLYKIAKDTWKLNIECVVVFCSVFRGDTDKKWYAKG